jgi:hypothetical protein
MRTDWISPSAATLVVGAFALVLGAALTPAHGVDSAREALAVTAVDEGRLLAMAVFYFTAAIGLTLGLPSVLSVFARRGRRLGVLGVAVFTVGVLGIAAFAMSLVFVRALVLSSALDAAGTAALAADRGLALFVYSWVFGFDAGLVLIALALLVARATPLWVPVLLLVSVAAAPLASWLGAVGPALQALVLAVGFTGVAVTAVAGNHRRRAAEPA